MNPNRCTILASRRTLVFATAALLAVISHVQAQEAARADAQAKESLPLNRVVMFNSGVGYFEHKGDVDGDALVELQFNVDDINDLLKSMILEDRGGGTISTVTYGSKDPITKTLQTFPIDLTDNPTLGQILDQVRGERVSVAAPNEIEGVLLGVEKRRKEVGSDHEVVEEEFLNLLTDQGLRSVPMQSVSQIKLTNEKLDAELRQALAVLASGHNTDKKTVALRSAGQWQATGARRLHPGNARLENQLSAGARRKGAAVPARLGHRRKHHRRRLERRHADAGQRPAHFLPHGPLRPPLRPTAGRAAKPVCVAASPTLWAGLERPGRARAACGWRDVGHGGERHSSLKELQAPHRLPRAAPAESVAKNWMALEKSQSSLAADRFGYIRSQPSAQAGDVGELFQYTIATPVTLARQKSAMLPIVNETVKGEKVSIYNPSVQAEHPLNGLRLTNSTDLHLMQGPITVFDDGSYAGDAIIADLAPGAERLISYALDLKTEVAPESKGHPESLVNVKIIKGTLQITRKLTREQIYTVKNSDDKAKTVLIEQPFDANWKLVTPKEPSEKTRDRYRFAVEATPGKPVKLAVEEEQIVSQQLALSNIDDGMIVYYSNRKEVSPQVKEALQEVVKRSTPSSK